MGVLAVQVDEPSTHRGELGHRRETAVDVGAASPVARDDAREHHLGAVGVVEATLDPRLGRALADEGRVGPAPEQQVDGLHEERLAGARLPRDRGEAGTDEHREVVDDPEVGDVELVQHRYRSARPNLAFKIWWKSRGPNVTIRPGFGPAVHATASPWHEAAELAAVDGEHHASPVGHGEPKLLVGVEHQ